MKLTLNSSLGWFNSRNLLFLLFFITIVTMLFAKHFEFEPIEEGAIRQILHPEYPQGPLIYDPYCNYNYIVASIAKVTGFNDNFPALAGTFWFIEVCLAVFVLSKLCDLLFKNENLALSIAAMFFILSQSGQVDQKTMIRPVYLLAIYYFLQKKWIISAICAGLIFYLHVGLAIWLLIPSVFALCVYLLRRKISLNKIISYCSVVLITALPVLYFYFFRVNSSSVDNFLTSYYYTVLGYCSSVILFFKIPSSVFGLFFASSVLFVGYNKAKNSGYKNNSVIFISFGVFMLFFLNFIFSDLLMNKTAIISQLLRSVVYIELFSSLYFAFLISQQIKKGNYIFFIAYIVIYFKYNLAAKLLGNCPQEKALNLFFLSFLLYEIGWNIWKRLFKPGTPALQKQSCQTGKFTEKTAAVMSSPVVISLILLFYMMPKFAIKNYLKKVLNVPVQVVQDEISQNKALMSDIAEYTNKNINEQNTLLLVPFLANDFDYYTKHRIFINSFTPLHDVVRQNGIYSFDFRRILTKDLGFPPENFLKDFTTDNYSRKWEELWRNLNENIIRKWKKEYHLTHVIREKEYPLKFPVLYENKFYVIYEIK